LGDEPVFLPENTRLFTGSPMPAQILDALDEAATKASDLLFAHFLGHGYLSDSGELMLTIGDSSSEFRSISYEKFRDTLFSGRTRNIVTALDLCNASPEPRRVFQDPLRHIKERRSSFGQYATFFFGRRTVVYAYFGICSAPRRASGFASSDRV
jgi:hypothetical protein